MNIIKNYNVNQESLNCTKSNKPKSLITISSDLPVKSLYQILIKNPNLVNIIDDKGETLLTYSIKRKKIESCQLILTSKTLDLSFQDKDGNSYLHLAVMNQLDGIVKTLLEKGIYINIQNNNGNSALHLAYLYNNIAIINILINNHIDTKIKNNDNLLAEDLKVDKGNDNQEKKIKENKQKKDKKIKSNIKYKDNKLKNQKNNKLEIININELLNNLIMNKNLNKMKNKSFIEIISSKSTFKAIVKKNSNINSKNNSNLNKNSFRNSEKKSKKEKYIKNDNEININIKSINLTDKKRKTHKIINNFQNNNKKKSEDNFDKTNKNLNFIDIGNNTTVETKYKSGIDKDNVNNEEREELNEEQKLNIKNYNREEEIFNIAESIDYKKKLAHTSELNTQIVKSPNGFNSKNYKKNKKEFQEDDSINIKDNNNISERNDIDGIDEEEEKIEEKDIIKFNENIFKDDRYLNSSKFEANQYDEEIENYNHFSNEDKFKEKNETINYFENSLLNLNYQEKKLNNNTNRTMQNIYLQNNGYKNKPPFYSLQNEEIYNNNLNLNNKNNLEKNKIISKIHIRKNYTKKYNEKEKILYKNKDDKLFIKDEKNISNINRLVSPLSSLSNDSKIIGENNHKHLFEFLSQINLTKYINNFIQNGFDDINLLIEQAKRGIYINDNDLKEAGIIIPGDRAKILIRIQEKAGNFFFNVPKNVYYSCNDLNKVQNDININKLKNWLKNLKIQIYLTNFVFNGYHSIELLLLQMESKNPLTVEILKEELGIEKIGHRSRIINKLKEEGRSYNNKLKTSVLLIGDNENNKNCDCLIY